MVSKGLRGVDAMKWLPEMETTLASTLDKTDVVCPKFVRKSLDI
jgi:hypothetical protein